MAFNNYFDWRYRDLLNKHRNQIVVDIARRITEESKWVLPTPVDHVCSAPIRTIPSVNASFNAHTQARRMTALSRKKVSRASNLFVHGDPLAHSIRPCIKDRF